MRNADCICVCTGMHSVANNAVHTTWNTVHSQHVRTAEINTGCLSIACADP